MDLIYALGDYEDGEFLILEGPASLSDDIGEIIGGDLIAYGEKIVSDSKSSIKHVGIDYLFNYFRPVAADHEFEDQVKNDWEAIEQFKLHPFGGSFAMPEWTGHDADFETYYQWRKQERQSDVDYNNKLALLVARVKHDTGKVQQVTENSQPETVS